jgi:hypothetical protein
MRLGGGKSARVIGRGDLVELGFDSGRRGLLSGGWKRGRIDHEGIAANADVGEEVASLHD